MKQTGVNRFGSRTLLGAFIACLLAGCGGGGGSSGPASAPVAVATVTPAPAATTVAPLSTSTPAPTPTPVPSQAPASPGPGSAPAAGVNYLSTGSSAGVPSAGGTIATSSSLGILIAASTVTGQDQNTPSSDNLTLAAGSTAASTLAVARAAQTIPLGVLLGKAPPSLGGLTAPRFGEPALASVAAISRLRRAGIAPAQGTRNVKSLPTSVGSTASLWVNNSSIGTSNGGYVAVPATLQLATTHGSIWIDNSLALSASTIGTIGSDFENAYTSDRLHFGTDDYPSNAPGAQIAYSQCDSNGNVLPSAAPQPLIADAGNTTVFIVSQANAGAGEGGYFDSINFYPQGVVNCFRAQSNQAAMIYLVWPSNANVRFEVNEDMVRGTAHEFQHLINFVNHDILASTSTQNPQPFERTFIDEGLSVLSQDFAVTALFGQVPFDVDSGLFLASFYLQAPQNYSIAYFEGTDPGQPLTPNCAGCYGGAYLFQRYLYDRFGGDAYAHAMVSAPTVGTTSLANVTGQSYAQLFLDFSIALASSGRGYNSDSRFNFASFNPYGSYTDQFRSAPLQLSGPGVTVISPGSSTGVATHLGSVVYGSVRPNAGAGSAVKVTDGPGGAFGLQAGLIQQ